MEKTYELVPNSTFISEETQLGENLKVHPGVVIEQNVKIGNNVTIMSGAYIGKDVRIGDNVVIYPGVLITEQVFIGNFVTIQNATVIKDKIVIKDHVFVGPFSVLRSEVSIDEKALIGPHCEVKSSVIKKHAKLAHRNYVANAIIGENVNLGCGVITANFHNNKFNSTFIGDNSKVGINCNLIAPISIGQNCFVAAGTTVSGIIADNTFVKNERQTKITKNRDA